MSVVSSRFWKLGSGNPYTGGCCGRMDVRDDTGVEFECGSWPDGAVEITEAEYEALLDEIASAWVAAAADVEHRLESTMADRRVLFEQVRAKLVAGAPLTPDEANMLGAFWG